MKGHEKNYTAHLEETHHIHKLDAPVEPLLPLRKELQHKTIDIKSGRWTLKQMI